MGKTVHDIIVWVEDTLVKDGIFSLPGKKALLEDDSIEIVLVDVTECPISVHLIKFRSFSGISGNIS